MDLYDTGKKGNGPKTALLKVMDLYDIERKGNGPVVHFALYIYIYSLSWSYEANENDTSLISNSLVCHTHACT
jgi:hypothetical protein